MNNLEEWFVIKASRGYAIESSSCRIASMGHSDELARVTAHQIAALPDLLAAAIALIERWDTPLWKDVPATAIYINNLRGVVAKANAIDPAIKPSTSKPFICHKHG